MTTHLLEFVVGSGSPNAHFNHAICFWAKIVQISILFAKFNRKEPHPRGSIMLFGCDDDTRCEVCYSVCPYRLIWSPTVAFKITPFYHVTFKWPYINQFLVLRAQLLRINVLFSHLSSLETSICDSKNV